MKRSLFTFLLTINTCILFAQNWRNNDQGIAFGLSGGTGFPVFYIKAPPMDQSYVYASSASPFSLGLYAEMSYSNYFSIRSSIFYQGMGSEINETATYDIDETYNLHYLEIPVDFIGHLPLGDRGANIFIGGGPFAALALNGTLQKTSYSVTTNDIVKFGANGDFKSIDYGLTTVLGYQTAEGLSFSLNAEFGIPNILQKSDLNLGATSAKTNVVYFSMGYSF